MGRNRIKIDLEDADGTRYGFTVEGVITRSKMLKVFDAMDLMNIEAERQDALPNLDTMGSKIWHIIDKEYPTGRFTSTELLEKYEDLYNIPIKLSVISTYLARFSQKGRLERTKAGRGWSYCIARANPLEAVPSTGQ